MILKLLILIPLISGCGQKVYVHTECPTIEPVKKIEQVPLHTDANGQLTVESSYDAVTMIKKHRIKEEYNDNEIRGLRELVEKDDE